MALLLTTERPIKEEIVSLAATLADTQRRLQEVAERLKDSDSDPQDWQARYEELHRRSAEHANGTKWLQSQIVDLEQKLEQQKPEIDNLLVARNAAFNKLKHARKVIRDLLDERRDMASPRGSLTQEDIDEALSDDLLRDDRSSSTESDKTVRIGTPSALSPPISARATPAPSLRYRIVSPPQSTSSAGRHTRASTSSRSVTSPTSHQSRSARSSPQIYHLYWKSVPACSRICEGPISWAQLNDFLKLDEDTVISLESFGSTAEVCMGLQFTQLADNEVVAFIYGPIFLEQEGKSYIIDWDSAPNNTRISRYIDSYVRKQKVFHTFHFPMTGQNDWFYVGALRWNVAPTVPVWPLEGESRQRLLKKMSKRTLGEVNMAEMERRLDSGEIVQLSIELSVTDEDHQRSQAFATQVLRLGGE